MSLRLLVPALLVACAAPAPLASVTPSDAFRAFLAAVDPGRPEVVTTVRVVDPTGTPLAGLAVIARDHLRATTWREVGRTGPDGTVQVRVRAGSAVRPFPSQLPRDEDVTGSVPRRDVLWSVPLEGEIPGEIELTTGVPLCDVELHVRGEEGHTPVGDVDVGLGEGTPWLARIDAGNGGVVRLPCEAHVRLVARGPAGRARTVDTGRFRHEDDYVVVDATRRWAEIPLAPARRLDVLVHDDAGTPVRGAAVFLEHLASSGVTLTDADGRETLWASPRLPSLLHDLDTLHVEASGVQPLEVDLEVPPLPTWLQLATERSVLLHETADGWDLDVTLARARWVEATCGGRPGSRCGLGYVDCSAAPGGHDPVQTCVEEPGELTVCTCPAHAAVMGPAFEDERHPIPEDARAVDLGSVVWSHASPPLP